MSTTTLYTDEVTMKTNIEILIWHAEDAEAIALAVRYHARGERVTHEVEPAVHNPLPLWLSITVEYQPSAIESLHVENMHEYLRGVAHGAARALDDYRQVRRTA